MRRYKCHKIVWAFQIQEIEVHEDGSANLHEEDQSIKVGKAYMDKHKPRVGGYYVQYKDGYESWSPKQEFEDGYTMI